MEPQTSQAGQIISKKVSWGRVLVLAILGFLIGILVSMSLGLNGSGIMIIALVLAVIAGFLGSKWKVPVYQPLSMADLTPTEWILWIVVSILVTPVISGTVGYYMYGHKNKYPLKWKRINIILVIGFIVDIAFILLSK